MNECEGGECKQFEIYTYIPTNIIKENRYIDRQIDRKIDMQKERYEERQMDRSIDTIHGQVYKLG